MNRMTSLSLVVAALAVSGCGSASVNASASTNATAETAAAADPEDVRLEGDHLAIDRHINFASDSDEILADSNDLLDHIAGFVVNHSAEITHLKIVGHTDAVGNAEHNQGLSERRAAAVVRALQTRGVTIQLESLGKGKSEPVCTEDAEECHAKNRRVEFLVIAD